MDTNDKTPLARAAELARISVPALNPETLEALGGALASEQFRSAVKGVQDALAAADLISIQASALELKAMQAAFNIPLPRDLDEGLLGGLNEGVRQAFEKMGMAEASSAGQDVPVETAATVDGPGMMRAKRATTSVASLTAVRRMDAYMKSKCIGQTEFAIAAGTTDRTIRKFRKTGAVRRNIFNGIAKAMGTTAEALLKSE